MIDPPTSGKWNIWTIGWSAIFLLLPLYRILPGGLSLVWTLGSLGLIVAALVLQRTARPLYPEVWVFAGIATIATFVILTTTTGARANIFALTQIAILLGAGVFALRGAIQIDPSFLNRISTAFVGGQTVSSVAAILQVAGVPVLGWATTQGRAPGLAGHPNVLGMLACIAVLICLGRLAAGGKRNVLVMVIAVAMANLGGLLATGSLSALFSGLLGISIAVVCTRGGARGVAKIVIATSLGGVAIATFSSFSDQFRSPADRFFQVTGQTSAVGTWEIRKQTYSFAWEKIQENPFFGVGLQDGGTFDGVTLTHNMFLRAWYQGGMLLGCAIAVVIIGVLLAIVGSFTKRENGIAVGILVTITGYAMTSAMMEQPFYWLPFLLAWASISPSSAEAPGFDATKHVPGDRESVATETQPAHNDRILE